MEKEEHDADAVDTVNEQKQKQTRQHDFEALGGKKSPYPPLLPPPSPSLSLPYPLFSASQTAPDLAQHHLSQQCHCFHFRAKRDGVQYRMDTAGWIVDRQGPPMKKTRMQTQTPKEEEEEEGRNKYQLHDDKCESHTDTPVVAVAVAVAVAFADDDDKGIENKSTTWYCLYILRLVREMAVDDDEEHVSGGGGGGGGAADAVWALENTNGE